MRFDGMRVSYQSMYILWLFLTLNEKEWKFLNENSYERETKRDLCACTSCTIVRSLPSSKICNGKSSIILWSNSPKLLNREFCVFDFYTLLVLFAIVYSGMSNGSVMFFAPNHIRIFWQHFDKGLEWFFLSKL